jgi:ubiquinone/menaquinone biosynthesis C-methylase UbiE
MSNTKTVDDVRKYWNARPCNIRHSPKPVGTKEYFDEVEARKYMVEPHIPGFAEFEKWKGKKVLEIGCGLGTDTINFARAGADVTAVDLTASSLELARRRAEVFGLKVRFYEANAEELSKTVPVETYDLIYSFGVIHHTPHPENVIGEIRKYMGPQSTLKIMMYYKPSWKVFWILLRYGKGAFWKLDELIAKYSEAQTGCPVTYTYTRRTIAGLLDGFDITDMFVDHIFPFKISDYVKFKYTKVWYFSILPAWIFRWMERRWGWHLCVTARLKRA